MSTFSQNPEPNPLSADQLAEIRARLYATDTESWEFRDAALLLLAERDELLAEIGWLTAERDGLLAAEGGSK